MEKRLAKVSISAAGGTAGEGAKTYKLTIPSTWTAAMGINEDDREVELTFEGDRIIVSRPLDMSKFAWRNFNKSHELKTFMYHDGHEVCTRFFADYTDKTICAENYTENLVKTAFGKNTIANRRAAQHKLRDPE